MTATDRSPSAGSLLAAYGSAVLSIVLATGVRLLLDPALGDHLPFVTYFVAVMFTAWFAGWGPSLVAMGLGFLTATYFFVSPRGSFAVAGLANQIGIALYFFVGIASALLSESQRRSRRRAEASMQDALAKQEELEQEVAQRTRTEEALRESESRYRMLAQTLPQLVWTCLPDGRCDYLSRQWVEYTGVQEERHLGYGWTEQVHPDDRQHVQDVWAGAVRDGILFDVEFRIRRADGQYRWFKTRAVPLRDPSGDIVKWFGSNTDIDELRRAEAEIRKLAEELEGKVRERTAALSDANAALRAEMDERRQAEDELHRSKERFQALVETIGDWIWEIDQKGRYTYVSPRVKDLLGYKPADLIGKTPFELMPSDEAERVAVIFEAFLSVHAPFAGIENTSLHKDGRRIVLETSGMPVFDGNGQFLGYRGVDRDITERKRAEEKLFQSREMLRRIIDNIPQQVFWKDRDLTFLGCNALFAKTLGAAAPAAIVGKNDLDFVPRNLAESYQADDRMVMETGTPKLNYEEPLGTPDGRSLWLKTSKVPLLDRKGKVMGILGIFEDITERKRIERELREAEERFRLLVEQALLGIYILGQDGRFLYVNPKMEEITGYTQDELRSSVSVLDLIAESDRSLIEANMRKRFSGEIPSAVYAFKGRRKDGSLIDVEVYGARIELNGTPAVIGMLRDTTQFNRMQAEARRLERLASHGQLLGGIAHELKNPLFILSGYLQIVKEKLAQRAYEDLPADWQKIQDIARRLTAIAERFLHLAAPVAAQQERCSVPAMLQETLDMVRSQLAQSRISVNASYAPNLPETWLVPGQVQEVFLNLVLNAVQAMAESHGKGTLTVKAELSAVSDRPSAPAERMIEVRIQDDGPGIPPEIQSKIFEPFFTTKPAGKGTGLGLWIVRSNLMMLRGTVRVKTEAGRGTTFIIRLPVTAEPSVDPQAPENGCDRKDRP
jgi:PAS domain S-box-containing protein